MDRYFSDIRPKVGFSLVYPALSLIVVVGGFLRLWRIDSLFHFMGDEGAQTTVEWRLIHGHLPLLGPSLSIGTRNQYPHLGPLFYYLAAGPLWISHGSPVGPTVFVGIVGLATVALMFFYLRGSVGDIPALGACLAMAVSFLMVEYSRRPWNPTLTPLFTLVFIYALISWKRSSSNWVLVASASLAALLQLQPVNLFLVLLPVVFIVLARPPMPSRTTLGLAVLIFLIISSPLIIYDATHHLANTRAWIHALIGGKSTAPVRHSSSIRLLFNLFNRAFEPRIIAVSVVLSVVLLLAGAYLALSDRKTESANWEILLPLILLVIAALGFEIYRKQVFEQYMVCLFVIPFVFLGALLQILWRYSWTRILALVLLAGLVIVGIRDSWTYSFLKPRVTVADASIIKADLQPDDTYGHVLRVDHLIVSWAHGRPFQLRMASYLNADTAYRYVLQRNGHSPRPARLTYLLIEPSSWPRKQWPPQARTESQTSDRSRRVGIVRLFEVSGP